MGSRLLPSSKRRENEIFCAGRDRLQLFGRFDRIAALLEFLRYARLDLHPLLLRAITLPGAAQPQPGQIQEEAEVTKSAED